MVRVRALVAITALVACGPVVSSSEGSTTTSSETSGLVGTTTAFTTSGATDPTTDPSTTIATSSGNPTTDPSTSTSGQASTESGDPSVADDGCGFKCLDWSTYIECDQWDPDCPPEEKCSPWATDGGPHWNAARCTPLDPDPSQPGEPCLVEGSGTSGIDMCALGSVCMFVDPETNEGVCVASCTGTPENPQCADPSTTCSIGYDGVMINCLPLCDPLAQDCVLGACYPNHTNQFTCGPTNGVGAPRDVGCDEQWDCVPGTICIDDDGFCATEKCCRSLCDLAMLEPCDDCSPWYPEGEAPPGLEQVGVCP